MSGELIAILAVGAAVLGVMLGALVPMLLAINGRLQTLGERVARIEGAMHPWRPANGAPVPVAPPETAP